MILINFRNGIPLKLDVMDNKLVLFILEDQEQVMKAALEDQLQDAPTVIKTCYRIHRWDRISNISEDISSAPRSRFELNCNKNSALSHPVFN